MKKVTSFMLLRLVLSTSIWFCMGVGVGWYHGNLGGFHRGVLNTSELFIKVLDSRIREDNPPAKSFDAKGGE